MMDERECEVCGWLRPVFVCSSQLGPITHAYCRECIDSNREPLATLVGGLYGCLGPDGKLHVDADIWIVINSTLGFYKKSVEWLEAEIKKLEAEYDAYMERENLREARERWERDS